MGQAWERIRRLRTVEAGLNGVRGVNQCRVLAAEEASDGIEAPLRCGGRRPFLRIT